MYDQWTARVEFDSSLVRGVGRLDRRELQEQLRYLVLALQLEQMLYDHNNDTPFAVTYFRDGAWACDLAVDGSTETFSFSHTNERQLHLTALPSRTRPQWRRFMHDRAMLANRTLPRDEKRDFFFERLPFLV